MVKKKMFININKVIWTWSPRVGWIGEKIKITKKGLAKIKVQQEKMEHKFESESDANE